jgi:hypothetical protein
MMMMRVLVSMETLVPEEGRPVCSQMHRGNQRPIRGSETRRNCADKELDARKEG